MNFFTKGVISHIATEFKFFGIIIVILLVAIVIIKVFIKD